jgi:hypothetical protein
MLPDCKSGRAGLQIRKSRVTIPEVQVTIPEVQVTIPEERKSETWLKKAAPKAAFFNQVSNESKDL